MSNWNTDLYRCSHFNQSNDYHVNIKQMMALLKSIINRLKILVTNIKFT